MFLYIMGFYLVMGILVAGVSNAVEEFESTEDMVWAFFLWPVPFVGLAIMGVTKVTKALINEQKSK